MVVEVSLCVVWCPYGTEGRTKARALKKLTLNRLRHSSGLLSAMRFTGSRTPWLIIRLSSLENRLMVVSTACGPIW